MTSPPTEGRPRTKWRFWLVLAALSAAAVAASLKYPDVDLREVRKLLGLRGQAAPVGAPAGERTADERVAGKSPGPLAPITVETARVQVQPLVESIRAVGSLLPDEAVTVVSEIAGRIERIAFREGQRVAAGDLLVQLDASVLKAELARSRSELTLSRANNERFAKLAREGMASPRSRDEALAALQAAEAGIALAEARLAKTTIRAPLSGVVGLRSVSAGAYVEPGQAIVELADTDPMKLDFRVPELALPALRNGQQVNVTIDALPGRRFEGTVYAIDPIVEVGGRAIRLRARIPNPKGELAPGLFARVEIVVDRRERAVLIPDSAVFARGDKRYVYRVVDGKARLTEIGLGVRRPGRVEVLAGLSEGDTVVTAGHQQLRDQAPVDAATPRAGA